MITYSIQRKFIYKLAFLLIISLGITNILYAEEKYEPYPIIFVHGYNNVRTTYDELWETTYDEFKKYFFDEQDEGKYFSNWDYRQKFDYIAESNGNLNDIADDLTGYINLVIDRVLKDAEPQEQKVVIVAHSAGGIVTRRLLAKYPTYQDKIEKVIFIGTPHLGSPLASGVILTDRMIPKLEEAEEESHKWSNLDFNLKIFAQMSAYRDRHRKIKSALTWFRRVVTWDAKVSVQEMLAGDPSKDRGQGGRYDREALHDQGQGVAVGQLVVPETVNATKTFIGKARLGPFTLAETEPITKTSQYDKTDTFLNNNSFAIPSNYVTLKGTGSILGWIMGTANGEIFKSLADFTGLPQGNTFDDLDNGDGIVTPASQTALGGETIDISRSHITEVNAWQTILQVIEDKPVIESVRAVRGLTSHSLF